jgi:NTE family protein
MSIEHSSDRLIFAARMVRRFALPIILFWLALTVVVNIIAPQLQAVAKTHAVPLSPNDAPSLIAMKRIGRDFQQFDSDTTVMVVLEGQEKLGDEAHRFYDKLVDRLSQDKAHVEHVEDFWGSTVTAAGSQSADGKAAYVQLHLAGDQGGWRANESVDAVQRIVNSVPPPPGLNAYVTGPGALAADRAVYGERSLKKITGISIAVIAVILLFAYRSIVTVLIMLLTVGIELYAVRGVISTLTIHHVVGLSTFTINVLVALTIAACTDYLIFLVGRYQEALSAGADRESAYFDMVRGTGHVVLGSGLTVAGAMYCLSFTRLPYFNTLGLPCCVGLVLVILASLTLAPAVVTVASRFGAFRPKGVTKTRRWRRIGTVVVRWPVPVLVTTTLIALLGLLALPSYVTGYHDRYYIPDKAPSNIGYHASDRHFPQARMEPEILMIEADHDLRNPTDMLMLDRIVKGVFHLPAIARVQSITRPLGAPIDHTSIPFLISMQSTMTIENLKYLKDNVADMSKTTDELQHMIDITGEMEELTRQLADATHNMNGHYKQIQSTANEIRDRVADFDDLWRPMRGYLYWERHCFDIPMCWSLRSLFDAIDGVDKLSEDLASLSHDVGQLDTIQPQMLALFPRMIATMQTVKGLTQTMTSTFSGLITQIDNMSRNANVMGRAFDASKNDDSFYLPPEAFDNPDFQRGLQLFLSPDGKSARFIITHKGDPATAEGISHIEPILQAATEAVKGTPLETANIYLAGTASMYKDIHEGAIYDLMIVVVASLCLIFLIMLAITRAAVAALVIVGTVTVSLGSAFGLSVLIWQHILHMPLHWLVLAMAIIVMLAVGSDYNLLMVARFQEEIGAGIKTGIIRSMASTGRVVTLAGLVFAFTMGAMVSSDLRVVGQIGTTIMIGLLFDILIVRSFMTPAVATFLGRWFWWPRQVRTRATSQLTRAQAVSPALALVLAGGAGRSSAASDVTTSPVGGSIAARVKRDGGTRVQTQTSLETGKGLGELSRRRQPSSMSVLLVAAFGAFLAFLDSTIVNIAFPDIQRSFSSYGFSSLSWVLNAYNIVFAAFLVAAGRLADVVGRKRTFIFGLVMFTVASLLCAIAGTFEQLVAFRVLQGIGSAVLVPASLALVVERFDASRRAHAVGLWGAAAAIAAALGPPVGGVLVQASSWRSVFVVNIPLGIVAVIAARRLLIESRASGRRRLPDLRGAMLLTASLGLLTLGLVKGPDWGWASAATIGAFVASAAALIGFVLSSRSHPAPLIDPAFLRIRSFVAGNLLTFAAATGFYCYILVHVLYLKNVWGYSLLKAGLAIAPSPLVAAVVAAVLGRVADRHGHRFIVAVGALVWAGSLVWYLQRVGPEPNFVGAWLPGQLIQGIGVGATLPVLGSAALAGLARGGSYATGSAVVSTTRQFGAVIGVGVLVLLIGKPEHGVAGELLRRGWTLAAFCFIAVSIAALFLGDTRNGPDQALEPEPEPEPGFSPDPDQVVEPGPTPAPPFAPPGPLQLVAPVEASVTDEADLLGQLPLFAGLDAATLEELAHHVDEVELEAGSFLFHVGDTSDSLYLIRRGRLQVCQEGIVLRELGRGDVVGELELLLDVPRAVSIRAVRDCKLVRLTKAQFDQIADHDVLAAMVRVLATRLHDAPPPAVLRSTSPEAVVSVIGVGADAPVGPVAAALLTALSEHVGAVDPGRIDRDGLDRAERVADKVVLHASVTDPDWRDFCVRVADRIVLVADDPSPQAAQLPERAVGADLVLAGPTASREHRRLWEELLTPRSVHAVRHQRLLDDLRPLAARIAGRSIGLVLGGGGARAFAHLGVIEELEAGGVPVDRLAGTGIGAVIAAWAASGLDAAAVDAHVYEYFIRHNPMSDYTVPIKGLVRGRRAQALIRQAFGDRLVEELPRQFRCVSVDLLSRRAVVHRRGPLADVVGSSLRLPGLYAPHVYNGGLHVDGGVLENLPVSTLAGSEGPLIAVDIGFAGDARGSATLPDGSPVVPNISDTLLRTMTIGSQMAVDDALARANVVIRPDTHTVGLMEFHQIDAARDAGRAAAREALPQIVALMHRSPSG